MKTLIHIALNIEAKPIIGTLKLACKCKIPFNIYENENIVLIVSGIGEENTKSALFYIQEMNNFERFINFGIAGCVDENIKIGTLFCTTHKNLGILHASISSHKNPITCKSNIKTLLVDMESETFLKHTPKDKDRYIFKIVSDHLSDKILQKNEVSSLVQNNLRYWIKHAR